MNVLLLSRPYTQDLKEKSQEKEFHASIFKPSELPGEWRLP